MDEKKPTDAKKKIFYQIPMNVVIRNDYLNFSYLIIFLMFILLLFTAFAIPQGMWLLLVLVAMLVAALILLNKKHSVLQAWMLENVRCPACHGKIKTSLCHYTFFPRGASACEVQCDNCNKKFVFKRVLLMLTLEGESK